MLQAVRAISLLALVCHLVSPAPGQKSNHLDFPSTPGAGVVEIYSSPNPDLDTLAEVDSQIVPAIGQVPVPGGRFVSLRIGQRSDFSFLDSLPSDAIEAIRLFNADLDANAIRSICRLESLRLLWLFDCKFSDDTFEKQSVLPHLRKLMVRSENAFDRGHMRHLVSWIATQPKLEEVYVTPSIDALDLQTLNGHPSMSTLSITLRRNRQTLVFKMLDQLPALKNLSVSVDGQVSPRSLDRLATFKKLEELSLFSAEVDGALLRQLSHCPQLRSLRLVNIQAGEGFTQNIHALKTVEKIFVTHGLWKEAGELAFQKGLTTGLLTLPKLRSGIRIDRLTDEIWQKLVSKADQWEELRIDGIRPGFDVAQLRELRQFRNLRVLKLSHVPLRDEGLAWLRTLEELEELTLWCTGLSGPGLEELSELAKLRRLLLAIESRNVKPDLAALAQLSQLRRLQIMGFGFEAMQFRPLAKCHELTTLTISEGQTDDRLLNEFANHPNLRILNLSESDITNDGLNSISRIGTLREFTGRGNFTSEGIRSLKALQKLYRLHLRSQHFTDEDIEKLPTEFPQISDISFRN